MKLIYRIKPPCSKCPYTLEQIRTVTNPCPQCKANGYQAYERFLGNLSKSNQGKGGISS